MNRLLTIFLIVYYASGLLLFPLGDMSYLQDMPRMYRECNHEDHGITVEDFVFEYLFTVRAVMEVLEGDFDDKEHPHQPQFEHNPVQLQVALTPMFEVLDKSDFYHDIPNYSILNISTILKGFGQEVYRPPVS